MPNVLHFKASRRGISHFHLHIKVNLPAKRTELGAEKCLEDKRGVPFLSFTLSSSLSLCLSVQAVAGRVWGSVWGGPME